MNYSNIIGNNKVKEYLNEQIKNNYILHSYLFVGTESIGKLMIATEFAKDILCINGKSDSCNCRSCISFQGGNHPDLTIINKESETIKIEQIRQLTNKIIEKPILSSRKVYIINDSDKMTTEAQNCLLKTLEEPPEFAVLILITSNENLLLNTIKSRCMKVNFQPISDMEMKEFCQINLDYNNITSDKIKTFDGSIGKAIKFKQNENEYIAIEDIVNSIKKETIIDIMNKSKILYNKEKVFEYLDYLIDYLYIKSKEYKSFLNCIEYTNDCIRKLRANGNLDMNLDMLLMKMWEEVNEDCNRC
ncbi:MAG: ATP-binding protein [Candidatus Scatovivens sp.]